MEKGSVIRSNNLKILNDFRYINISKYIDLKLIISSVIGFLLSRSMIISSISPLGIAFFVGNLSTYKYKVLVFLSCILGTLFSQNTSSNIIRYIACLSIIMLASLTIKDTKSNYKLALLGVFAMLPVSLVQMFFSDVYIYDIFVYILEILILFISTYIFSFGIDMIINHKSKVSVRVEETIAVSFIIIFSIMGMDNIEFLGFSLRGILSTFVILISCIVGGSSIGSVSGVIVGVSFMLNNINLALYIAIYSLAGLIGGTFYKVNRFLCVISYALTWTSMYLYIYGVNYNLYDIRDMILSSLLVLLIPKSIFKKLDSLAKLNISSNDVVDDYIKRNKELVSSKLINICKAYEELADTFDKVREREKVIDNRDVASVIDMIHNDECKNCSMRRKCWDVKFNYTYTLMCDILEKLENSGEITINSIGENFKKECLKPEQIVKIANYYYKLFVLDYNWSLKLSESRKLVANQIRSISKSIENITDDFRDGISINIEKEKEIYDELQRNNINANKVTYNVNNGEVEISIEKSTCSNHTLCDDKITNVLSEYVGEQLCAQKIGCHSYSGNCKINFRKAQKYRAITQVAKMSRDGHILCGDNYTYMDISDGKYMMAISDGMGKGKKAYEESYVTIDILEKMMDSEIDDNIVINTINNMLLLKSSTEEMFSTIDLGIIDLKRGVLETIKMGACSTYIIRDKDNVDLISSASLPVGILSDIKLDRKNVKIEDGNYIIMVSDGVVDAGKNKNMGDNWLIYFLKNIKSTNPNEIANKILDKALEIQDGNVEDDMTVLVTKICS